MSLCEPRLLERCSEERHLNWQKGQFCPTGMGLRARRRGAGGGGGAAVAVVVSLALVAIAKAYQKLVVLAAGQNCRRWGTARRLFPKCYKNASGVAHTFEAAGCSSVGHHRACASSTPRIVALSQQGFFFGGGDPAF
jgi:hypothetical protein